MTKRTRKQAPVVVNVTDETNVALETITIDTLTATDQVDVNAVLEALAPTDSDTPVIDVTDSDAMQSLRDIALSFDQGTVDTMIDDIRATFAARDTFEESRGLDLNDSASSYAKAKRNMLANAVAVARGFLALNVEPVNVIRRKVMSNNEFTAKGLDKVTEVCAFICGNASRFQRVTQAFIACSIAVADRDASPIGNKVNRAFLSNASFDKLVNDAELAAYLRDYQHKFMSGGRDTQSSQVRNVLDVLGLATICTVEHARGGISINRDHGFYQLFRNRYMTQATDATVTA
jgi:hypothetical protein